MKKQVNEELLLQQSGRGISRRKFFGITGGAAAMTVAMAACVNTDDDNTPTPTDNAFDLGTGDLGILNYAYALEQLEAAFYTRVIESQFSGMTIDQRLLLTDIRDHEIAHREFFKSAISTRFPGHLIPNVVVDFQTIDFGNKNSVLTAAKTFEDLGVSAYNGAGQLIMDPQYLLLAGKIASVEARHAGYIRDLLQMNSFSDDVVINGLDTSRTPAQVIELAKPYMKSTLNASNLPTF